MTFRKVTMFLLLFSLFLAYWPALAGVTGKITGKVIDKQTGEPLPGVNIILVGTTLGAATDANGNYVILNVPPGTYTLRASFIGYSTVEVTNLRVNTDRTTQQDFALAPEIIAGKEVVVVAERPLVQKDLTASQTITTGEEIEALPVLTFTQVMTTQAGVNTGPAGEIHIRGGRTNEVGYYIDGISVANPFFTNSLSINVSNKALEELRVVSGAFNAEYGNAMSGIVNIQIKEGGANYSGSISAYTGDYISNDTDLFMNIDDIDPLANYIIEGTLTGPVPLFGKSDRFTFNISGRYHDNEGYLYGRREHLPSDSANFRTPNWYIELNGDNAYVPMNFRKDLNLLAKFTLRLSNAIKISTQLLHDRTRWKQYVHAYKYNPDGTYNYRDNNSNYSIKLNHAFTRSFYEANLYYATTSYKRFVYEDPQDPRYVPTTRVVGTPTSATFVFGGTQMGHTYRDSKTIGGKLDYTVQIGMRHEVKTGISFRLDNLREQNFTILYDNQQYKKPTVKPPNESPSHTLYDKDATFFSAYIQDKIEYNHFIVNAGVRYDYFNPNDEYFVDFLNPEGEKARATPKHRVSPRLGVAFPITDRGILHFSYGHFYQMPTLRRLYQTQIFGAGLNPIVGYANLKPEKTVNYEFGLQQQLTDVLAIEATIFFKDIRDLLALQTIKYESQRFGPSEYRVWLNKDYGAVKGFTFNLTKRYDPETKLSAWLDYTFQKAEGNDVRTGAFFFNALAGIEEEKIIVPLNWDQRHVFNVTVTLSEPKKWGVSMIARISSGWPYTPDIPNANYIPRTNSGRKPWQRTVDVRIHRNFPIGKATLVLFAQIFNLFDTRNERYVFNDTGRAGYTFLNRSSQETEEFKRHYGEPGIHTWEEYMTRPHYYTAPRSVQLGLSLEF